VTTARPGFPPIPVCGGRLAGETAEPTAQGFHPTGFGLLRCVVGAVVADGLPGLVREVSFGNFRYQTAAEALRRRRPACK
jgi:hypothetical protein